MWRLVSMGTEDLTPKHVYLVSGDAQSPRCLQEGGTNVCLIDTLWYLSHMDFLGFSLYFWNTDNLNTSQPFSNARHRKWSLYIWVGIGSFLRLKVTYHCWEDKGGQSLETPTIYDTWMCHGWGERRSNPSVYYLIFPRCLQWFPLNKLGQLRAASSVRVEV
jgi:hypothetical protein